MIEDFYLSGFVIKRPTVSNVGGVPTETWATVATISGRMRPLSGNEIIKNEKLNYTTTHRFYCNPIALLPTDVISKDGKNYDVKLIRDVMEMNQHLEIDCELRES